MDLPAVRTPEPHASGGPWLRSSGAVRLRVARRREVARFARSIGSSGHTQRPLAAVLPTQTSCPVHPAFIAISGSDGEAPLMEKPSLRLTETSVGHAVAWSTPAPDSVRLEVSDENCLGLRGSPGSCPGSQPNPRSGTP